jgi:hypothetical protein
MDQKNHHKIPSVSSRNDFNPPRLRVEATFPKGEIPIASLWQREVACLREAASAKAGEGFYEVFQTAKALREI